MNAGFVFAEDGPGAAAMAPRIGEHSREVLDALGYGDDEIERLLASGAVRARAAEDTARA